MRLIRRIAHWLRIRSHETDLNDEIAFHREMVERELASRGMAPVAAEVVGRQVMGNVTRAREDARGVWIWPWLESAMQDVAYAMRGLRRQPGFSAVAIGTLGLAVGMNTSVFTAFSSVYRKSWPVSEPATVFEVSTIRGGRERHSDFSLAEYRELVDRARNVSRLVGMACTDGFSPGCDVWLGDVVLRPAYVSGNAFQVFGVPMERGRGLLPADDQAGSLDPAVVVSHDVWVRQLAADPAIVGRKIQLDGVVFSVVGVAAQRFGGTSIIRTDLWMPLSAVSLVRKRDAKSHLDHLQLAARVTSVESREPARAELEALTSAMRERPTTAQDRDRAATHVRLAATSLDPNPVKRRMGYAMFGLMLLGSALVIVLACANVANLHLARAAARGREIAVRVSLGASRRRVIRQLLTESLVLAAVASVVGLAITFVAPFYLLKLIAGDSLSSWPLPDLGVLGYAIGLTLLTCLAFGLAPARHAASLSVTQALKGRYGLGSVSLSLRGVFLAAQVAISVIVLCGAGFLMRGLSRAAHQDFGFAVADVAAVSVRLPPSHDSTTSARFARELTARVTSGSDRRFVGATTSTPFGSRDQELVLQAGRDSSTGRWIQVLGVSGGYFDVLRMPLLAGRMIGEADAQRQVIVVNEALAREMWPGQTPVGQTLIIGAPHEVIGVVKDADTEGVQSEEGSARAKIYRPLGDGSADVPSFVVRLGSVESVRAIGEIARSLTPAARVTVEPVSTSLNRHLAEVWSEASIAAMLGGVSLVLVSIGIFGVFAYVVQQRTREIGIRMSLGAQRRDVVRVVIESSARPIVVGLAIGLAGAVAESVVVRRYLYGLSPFDPVTYVAIVGILGVAALIAVYLPARRAARITPVVALRAD